MNNTEYTETTATLLPASGTRFTLDPAFAAKKKLNADVTYVVITQRKIGKNVFNVARLADDENAKPINVQTENMIIAAPITEDEIADESAPRVTAHSECTHESTKSARAACRRARAAAAKIDTDN